MIIDTYKLTQITWEGKRRISKNNSEKEPGWRIYTTWFRDSP